LILGASGSIPNDFGAEANPEASLHIVASLGAGGVSTGCLRLCVHLFVLSNDILTLVVAYFRRSRY
jgi:hypothetical protein